MSKRCCALLLAALTGIVQAQSPSVADRIAVRRAQVELLRADRDLLRELQDQAGSSAGALPSVHAVMGLEGAMTVRLQLSNGQTGNYKVGERIRQGMTVGSIAPREVWVSVGTGKLTRSVPLEFRSATTEDQPRMGTGTAGTRPQVPIELLPPPPTVQLPGVPSGAAAIPTIPASAQR